MPDEEIDKLIRDAASQHHPPYDDTAWGKMEVLLDEHLPQKKDRKRLIFFLLTLLLLGGAIFFAFKNTGKTNTPEIASQNTDTKKTNAAENNTSATVNNISPEASYEVEGGQEISPYTNHPATQQSATANAPKKNIIIADSEDETPAYVNGKAKKHNQKGRFAMKVKKPGIGTEEDNSNVDDETNAQKSKPLNDKGKTKMSVKAPVTGNNDDAAADTNIPETEKAITKEETEIIKKDSVSTNKETEKTVTQKEETASQQQKKKNKGFGDNFAITLSAGADMSYVSLDNPGKWKPVYGAGLAYSIGKHFTVSSGVYVSKKIYAAKPSQYKVDYTAFPYLVNIDGDCNIVEIPLTVYYSFGQAKKHSWIGGLGLSSLLMKKESYDYQYAYPGGQTYSYQHSVTNENKHYFSVLSLSAGYRYNLNKFLSFTAEPYLKLPLGGVGLGKVKLNSMGILFTTTIRPFAKKK